MSNHTLQLSSVILTKEVRRPGASRFWSFYLSSMNYLFICHEQRACMEGLCLHRQLKPRVRHCTTARLTAKNAMLFESLRCGAEDLFLLEWESWSYTDVIKSQDSSSGQQYLQLCIMTEAVLEHEPMGEKKSPLHCNPMLFILSSPAVTQSSFNLSSQHLQLCLSNQLFKSDLNSTRHSFEKYMFFPRRKASQSRAATGPDQYCQAGIKM